MESIDFETLAKELLRALRGSRSQVGFSRRLHYKSNVAYLWEAGRNWPTAAVFLWAASRVGVDTKEIIARFYRSRPVWLGESEELDGRFVCQLLEDLRGDTPIQELAARTGKSRYAIARWLKGQAEPRLPDFLRLIEATSQRLLDFVALLVDIETLPSVVCRWRELCAARELVSQVPWAPAVLLALQTRAYLELVVHTPGWIAERLGLPREVEDQCIELLRTSGQVRAVGKCLRVARVQAIDTRADPSAGRRLREWWASVGLEHIRADKPGLFSFNIFSVSSADYIRLQDMHRNYYRALRSVVAASEPEERVVVANVQLFALDAGDNRNPSDPG